MPQRADSATNQAPPTPPGGNAPDQGAADLAETVLLVRLGERRFAVPAEAVIRILPMAELLPLPDAPPGIAGMLAVQGLVLPAVDPRARLGLPPAAPLPDQHLVLLAARTRFLLWIDRAETIVAVPAGVRTAVLDEGAGLLAPQIARIGDDHIPVLAPAALDPGRVSRPGAVVSR